MPWLGLLKFVLGFALAIAVLAGTGITVTQYLMNRYAVAPPRPTFSEETPKASEAEQSAENTPSPASSPAPNAEASPSPSPSPSPASPSPSPEIPENAYEAQVTWSTGLVLRDSPVQDAARVGGIGFNEVVVVLEDSEDGNWQRVRVTGSGLEGWVKAGNVAPISQDFSNELTE